MSAPYVYRDILIVNTRSTSPNVLCATQSGPSFIPQLSVYKGTLPANCRWNIGWASLGAQYTIEITDHATNNTYQLAIPTNGKNDTLVSLVSGGSSGYCTAWAFAYPTRLLSGLGTGMHSYDGTQGTLSLDAGKYPVPIVFDFNSNVNQTWEFGYSMDALKPSPF